MENKYDVVIIGSGIAGLTVSLTLPQTLRIALISKGTLYTGATGLAQGGIAGVISDNDSPALHIADTLKAGSYHNNKEAVRILSEKSRDAIMWLMNCGVPFELDNEGRLHPGLEAAHSVPRIAHASDFTGKSIQEALISHIFKQKHITAYENTFCKNLIVAEGSCKGIVAITGDVTRNFLAHQIVLATGGIGQVYEWTTNPIGASGDGIALAIKAGASLADMEFIQFHPTALKKGTSPLFLLSEALRGENAYIVNKKGERFLLSHLQQGELSPRDAVSRVLYEEMQRGEVFLDLRHLDSTHLKKRFANIYRTLHDHFNLNIAHDLIPITPAAHYLCGGIKTDLDGRTSITNLFAVGEVAATGVHGANRLASNSLLEGVVYGKRVAQAISLSTNSQKYQISDTTTKVAQNTCKQTHDTIRTTRLTIQQLMWDYVGIVRTHAGLSYAKKQIENIKKTMCNEKKGCLNVECLEVQNIADCADAVIHASLHRTQSLGAHYLLK